MKFKFILALIFGFTASFTSIYAQQTEFSCAHSEMQAKLWNENPQMKADFYRLFENSKQTEFVNGVKRSKIIIPIVFHIIHDNGLENLADSIIYRQIEILNRDYQKLNFDTANVDPAYKDIIANCGFEFRLATKDPQGNCTNGINHYQSHLAYNGDDGSKLHQWNRDKYLNVWITNSIGKSGVAGYAYFPGSVSTGNFSADGVIILYNYISDLYPSNDNNSRALTHEIGHYLGLYHVWGGSNDPLVACGDDEVEDTPKTKGYKACVTPSNSYNNTCEIQNFSELHTFDGVTASTGSIDSLSYNTDYLKVLTNNITPHGISDKSSLKNKIAYTSWDLGAKDKDTVIANYTGNINENKYYEVDVIGGFGNGVNINGISFLASRNLEGIKSFCVKSSVDGYKNNLKIISNNTKISNVSNNVVSISKDTTKAFTAKVLINDKKYKDLRDGNKITFRIYAWNAEATSGSFILDSVNLLLDSSKVTSTYVTANNVSSNSIINNHFAFGNWPLGGVDRDTLLSHQVGTINTTKFYEVSISANKRKLMDINTITFIASRNSNGIKHIAVRSSVDNFTKNLPIRSNNSKITSVKNNELFIKKDTTKNFTATVTLTDNAFKDLRNTSPITFRIYAWNAEDVNGIFDIDSLSINGVGSSIENVENYMEYSYCSKMFTNKQAERMLASLASPISNRNNLHKVDNLIATGTESLTIPTCIPQPYFTASSKKVCKGSVISFKDVSWKSGVTNRKWYFQDGTPNTSTESNPKILFDTPGDKKVVLIVENAAGKDSLVMNNFIHVSEDLSFYTGTVTQNFEAGRPWDWMVENPEENYATWDITNFGKNNTKGFKLNNFKDLSKSSNYNEDDNFYFQRLRGNKDAIISPAISFTTTTEPTLTFDYSYATTSYYDSLITEKLDIYYSDNCGRTWKQLYTVTGPNGSTFSPKSTELVTAGLYSGTEFNPTTQDMWKTVNVDLSKVKTSVDQSRIRLKFEFTASNYSNNLFIDNINVNGILGVEESPLNSMDISIKPNPTTNSEGIIINYKANNEPIQFVLTDVQGKIITNEINTIKNSNVEHTMKLDKSLNAGYYYLKITQGNYSTTRKVVVM